MAELANKRLDDAEAQAIQQAITELGQLALQDEKQAVQENAEAFTNAVNDLAGYNAELANTIAEATVGAAAIRDLNAAISGAEAQGATDIQINTVLDNLNTKLQLIGSVRDKVAAGGLGSVVKSGSKSKSEKDTTKEFDWIEQAIENIEKEVQNLDEVVNSAYSTFSQKNEALAKEIGKVSEEIGLQQKAYDEYMRKADSIGLSEDYKALVRDGAINIENISDEKLQKKISDYQQWYEKAVDVSDAISDLNEKLKDLHVKGYELKSGRLEDLLDSDSITEKQYLEEMKRLYKEYYEDQVEYAQKAHEAKLALLEKEKSYLNSVANAASSLLDKEIDKIRDNAKEQEKPLKEQIDAYNKQIDLLNKKKKPLQDELDALEDKAREENLILGLQQKQYNLKRLENQRTKLLYTKDKGMIWDTDPQAIRDAKKDVDDAKLAIKKNDIQKQIDALDDEIDRYNDLIDLVNDQIDAINESADNQIDALEKIKNKWQEVIDQQEYAQNLILLTGEFGADAITKILTGNDDDLLAQWKNNYINTLADIDMESQGYIGNMTEQIASLYGVDLSSLQSQFVGVKDSANDMTDALSEADDAMDMSDTAASMDETAKSMDNLSTATSDANENTKAMSENMGTLSTNTAELGENATTVSDALSSIPDAEKFNVLTTSFTNLAEAIKSVADALGVSGNGTVNSLVDTLQSLSTISIDADGNGLITQFNNLKTAIEGVTSAISGGGMSGGSAGEGSPSSSPSMSAGAGGKGSAVGGLISAVESIKNATDEALGTGNGEEGGGTGAIGQFEQLEDAVDDVTAAIGGGVSSGGGQGTGESDGDNADSLIGSIVELGDTTEEILTGGGESEGESGGVIGRFEEFSDVIEEAKDHVTGISEGLDEIDGKEVECTIRVNIETNGSLPAFAEGTLGDMNLESGEYTAKYGKAFAEGTGKYKGLPKAEKNALVSEYGQTEMTVLPNGKTIITDEPTMMDLPKDTVIFNEEQTKKIMDNKVHVDGGANTSSNGDVVQPNGDILKPDGTVIKPNGVAIQSDGTIITPEGKVYEPLRPGDRMYDMLQKFNAYFNSIDQNVEKLTPNSFYDHQKQMEQMANQITNYNNVVNNTKNVQPVVNQNISVTLPNVTNSTSAEELLRDLQSINTKKFQVFG